MRGTITALILAAALTAAAAGAEDGRKADGMNDKVDRTDEQWREILTPEQYRVLRGKGTEPPYSGRFDVHFRDGVYVCAGCGNPLFESDAKFDAGCGWPSYWRPIDPDAVKTAEDRSHGMVRTEVLCAGCGSHLGHVFPDGPRPTGLRYCINSVSLDFDAAERDSGDRAGE